MIDEKTWHWMNYGMSADFIEHYVVKHPEPPDNPWHSDLATIRDALRDGEKSSLEALKRTNRWVYAMDKHGAGRVNK